MAGYRFVQEVLERTDRFEITVAGKSGHAAHPNDAVDPIVAACHLVTQLQTVVSQFNI